VAVLFKLPSAWPDEPLEEYRLMEAAWLRISTHFNADNQLVFLPSRRLPALGNSEDVLMILNQLNEQLEIIEYGPNDHYAGLSNKSGHSLFKPLATGTDGSRSWHFGPWTTSFSEGGATPGWIPGLIRGKGQTSELVRESKFLLQTNPKSFYPEHVNLATQSVFYVKTPQNGAFVQLDVYNSQGYLITQLEAARFVDDGWTYSWAGKDQNENFVPAGIYIVVATFKNHQGTLLETLKQPVAVLRRQ